uniref:ATP synthase complex subunit 8 n=1 Tax=Quedenfeldtia trachyblepharus TaxID=460631 RepID=A0A343J8Q1_9SAUR|nr:ATP synthase F0 subunit 8 [Quedenfeldtia trachyblepharus]ASW34711.1 ATP synthase F0 subunit 8 [Quedenfeldtia trachyblepharus]
MPQLDPAPWFTTMMMTWLVLSLMLMPKLTRTQLITPSPLHHTTKSKTHWPWPWC